MNQRAVSRERMTGMKMNACSSADSETMIVTDIWIEDAHSNTDLCDMPNNLDRHGGFGGNLCKIGGVYTTYSDLWINPKFWLKRKMDLRR